MKELEMALVDKDKLTQSVKHLRGKLLEDYEEEMLLKYRNPKELPEWKDGFYFDELDNLKRLAIFNHYAPAMEAVEEVMSFTNGNYDEDDLNLAGQLVLNMYIELFTTMIKRISTDYYLSDNHTPINNVSTKILTQTNKAHGNLNLKVNFEKYMNETGKEQQWTKSTFSINKTAMDSLLYEFGDVNINSLTKNDLDKYKNKLSKLPRRWNYKQNRYFNGCSTLDEIIEKNELIEAEKITLSTVAKYIGVVKRFFDYLHEEAKIDINIAEKLKVIIPRSKKKGSKRKPYSTQDLNTLFNVPFYTTKLEKNIDTKIEKVFIPIISLYSGMRLNEISSLYIDDIQQEDGIYYFDINDDNDKTTKNEGSNRRVPIHPKIIEAGFLDFYNDFKSKNSGRLWSSLTKQEKYDDSAGNDEGIYGKKISSWYGRINRKYVTKNRKKVFHSFRHNAINNLKQQDESKDIIRQLVGHNNNKDKDMTFGTYGEDYSLETVQRVANKIHYNVPALDLVIEKIGAHIRQKEV